MKIFVSHNRQDGACCHQLVATLERRWSGAGADVWYEQHYMEAGRLGHTIEEQLRDRPVFVVVLSPAALGSRWVEDEARWAYNLARKDPKRLILPVVCAAVKEADIWLFLGDFRRIETGANQPFAPAQAIRQTLRVLTLPPARQASGTPTPKPGESLAGLLIQGNALLARKRTTEALRAYERATAWRNLAAVTRAGVIGSTCPPPQRSQPPSGWMGEPSSGTRPTAVRSAWRYETSPTDPQRGVIYLPPHSPSQATGDAVSRLRDAAREPSKLYRRL